MENLSLAWQKARKGKKKKDYVIEFERNLEANLKELHEDLSNCSYIPESLSKLIIRDPKSRVIYISDFRDRIVHHAIINILSPIFEPIFIYDSFASQKRKGHHKAIQRFNYFKRKVSHNGKKLKGIKDNNYIAGYALKIDIKQYFESMAHKILIDLLSKKIKDGQFIELIRKILRNYPAKIYGRGMPLGNYTSQFFANVYLNELDYFCKHSLKLKYYIRYVDDIVILHNNRDFLERCFSVIKLFLKYGLQLEVHKEKSGIIPLHSGVKFLGFRIFYYYSLLKQSSIKEIKRRLDIWRGLAGLNKNEELYKTLSSKLAGWLSHAEHGDTFKLRNGILERFNEFANPLII